MISSWLVLGNFAQLYIRDSASVMNCMKNNSLLCSASDVACFSFISIAHLVENSRMHLLLQLYLQIAVLIPNHSLLVIGWSFHVCFPHQQTLAAAVKCLTVTYPYLSSTSTCCHVACMSWNTNMHIHDTKHQQNTLARFFS